ncbi:MAG: ribonuclease catalytic domain-containing protein [Candidatus Nanohaloarchaea archaeon]|nr:ribonuclease catalytic domain-containing protein [Candidatus Nanohaloarchaea archaeon]
MSMGRELRNAIPKETAVDVASVAGYDLFLERADRTVESAIEDFDRIDLRHLDTYTIDPGDAHEYDDALSVEARTSDGDLRGYTAWVHVADVASFVPEDGLLDMYARAKGRTFYYADGADHMLPEDILGKASLEEGRDRPANTVEMRFGEDGHLEGWNIYRSMVHADHNLSYEDANELFFTPRPDDELERRLLNADAPESGKYPENRVGTGTSDDRDAARSMVGDLEDLDFLAMRLSDRRRESLIPDRSPSYRTVEEFMVHANRAAAEELSSRGTGIYRVHGEPQGWQKRVSRYLNQAGLPGVASEVREAEEADDVIDLQKEFGIPLIFKGEAERKGQAYYAIAPRGHEALNLDYYAPFTSPARRYEDLVNWRLLYGESELRDVELDRMAVNLNRKFNPSTFEDEEAEFEALFG